MLIKQRLKKKNCGSNELKAMLFKTCSLSNRLKNTLYKPRAAYYALHTLASDDAGDGASDSAHDGAHDYARPCSISYCA